MVTFETKVLPEGWLSSVIRWNTSDQQYEYPNGSIISVGGLDTPSKIMSSEYDMIYVQEAIELTEEDWETLTTRLRNHVMPYQQLIADTNPSYPTHWLKMRCDRGATLMLLSRHQDNPSVTQDYLDTLDALTGVRRLRLRDGIWAAAEGLVYDNWDPAIHIVTKKQLTDWNIFHPDGTLNRLKIKRFVAGVDWGFKNPGSIGIYAVDRDDRLYLLREVYRTRKLIGWWVEQAQALDKEFGGIDEWICDPSEPGFILDFCNAGLNAFGAVNDIRPGIDAAQERLDVRGDGRAGFYLYEFALQDRDDLRDNDHLPVCFENEINAYVYPKLKDGQIEKEVPLKLHDHSLDQWRYTCKHLHVDSGIVELDSNLVESLYSYVGY